jgi:hypothetical protein
VGGALLRRLPYTPSVYGAAIRGASGDTLQGLADFGGSPSAAGLAFPWLWDYWVEGGRHHRGCSYEYPDDFMWIPPLGEGNASTRTLSADKRDDPMWCNRVSHVKDVGPCIPTKLGGSLSSVWTHCTAYKPCIAMPWHTSLTLLRPLSSPSIVDKTLWSTCPQNWWRKTYRWNSWANASQPRSSRWRSGITPLISWRFSSMMCKRNLRNPTTTWRCATRTWRLLGVCFVAEDPVRRNTFDKSSQKQCRSYYPQSFGIVACLKTKDYNRHKDEMTDWSIRVCVIIVIFCKGHECNISQAVPCAYK